MFRMVGVQSGPHQMTGPTSAGGRAVIRSEEFQPSENTCLVSNKHVPFLLMINGKAIGKTDLKALFEPSATSSFNIQSLLLAATVTRVLTPPSDGNFGCRQNLAKKV